MNKWFIVLLIFLFSTILRLWNLNQMGRTWDEGAYVEMGYRFVQLIQKGDFTNSYWYKTSDAPPFARYVYGLVGQLDISHYDYTFSRLVSVLLSSLSTAIVTLIGWKYVSSFVGITAGLIFATLPFFLGFSQLATLESFIMFFFTASVYYFLDFLENLSLKKMIITGVLIGFSLLTKYTNILLLPLFILIYLLWYFHVGRNRGYKRLNYKLVGIFITALITFFLLWPMPWLHLKEVINFNYEWRIIGSKHSVPEVFFGRLMLTPKIYYIVHFLITTPLIILGLFFVGLKNISDKKKWVLYALVAWFVLPFAQSLYNFRQHGIRYIIEIYAPFSLIAAIGFDYLVSKFTKSIKTKVLYLIPVVIYMLIILIKITPYYLDYFNILVGGAKGVYEKRLFQLGWWGQGIKEAVLYVAKNARTNARVGLAVEPLTSVPPIKHLKMYSFEKDKAYDYVLVSYFMIVREGFDDSSIKKNYNLVHSVSADGASLIDVYQRKVGNM